MVMHQHTTTLLRRSIHRPFSNSVILSVAKNPRICRCLFLFFVVACSCCHPERVVRARRTPTNSQPAQPLAPFSHKTPAHSSQPIAHSRSKKIAAAYPQKPQQIRVSSPCIPEKSHNPRSTNHFRYKNSWHSSYAPSRIIKVWGKCSWMRWGVIRNCEPGAP